MKRNKIMAMIMAALISSSLILGDVTTTYAADSTVQAKAIVEEMTIEQKIGQMLMPDFRQWKMDGEDAVSDFTTMNSEVAQIIDDFDLGGVILFAQNVKTTEQTTKLTHDLQQVIENDESNDLPLLITVDQEGGIVTRLGTGTSLPGNMALGATKNELSSYRAGSVIGKELNSLGINVNFSPSLDVNNNPANPVIGLRSFSSNADLVSKLGIKMINGIQEQGVSGAAKHFPGHGDTATDSHYGLPVVDKSYEELKEIELKPFKAAIENGVDMIMTAHVQLPQIEKDTVISKNDGQEIGIPSTLSDDVLTGVLREDMGYNGIIITDALNMDAISKNFGEVETVKMAIKAGVDIALMPTILRSKADVSKLQAIVDGIKEAVESGELTISEIDDSVERIVKLKIDRGIINVNNDTRTVDEKIANAKTIVGSNENRAIEREISAEAITVVKNENNILPLNPKEGQNVLLIAPYDNELPGMKFGVTRLIAEGKMDSVKIDTHRYSNGNLLTDELKAKIGTADYVVVISEMGNFSHLNVNHWITAGPTAIVDYANELNKDSVIVSVGKPYDVAAHKNAKAEVIAYGYKGMDPTEADGGLTPTQTFGPNIPAAMEVIFGGAEAQGTLPVDIPQVDETGAIISGENAYNYGFGITNLTSVGVSTSTNNVEVKASEKVDVKLSLSDIDGLKSENYSLKVNFNNSDFEVVSVKANNENLSVVNHSVDGSLLTINLSDINENALTDVIITLKAVGEAQNDLTILSDVKVIDGKDREFTTSGNYSTINIIKDSNTDVPVDPENPTTPEKPTTPSKPGSTSKPNSGKLPNTGGTSSVATSIFATLMATTGAFLSRKKK
ncbi:glycoside hydrolase family 3 N-terminal domain-containing protein [Clostridium sp. D53t1_180928_C8]|uniref:glycoside hydrolase family 3 N-terminal domain-containing protein n=1 Tax=Clostridium sp. D53t1_180928_C8 TaxID=2787101 RepID=UPI0018A93D2A|nr:glycoside hydrolase family 3 N-terminal domain-containing protein [Clostridium sp. D53t1_180928_C8]